MKTARDLQALCLRLEQQLLDDTLSPVEIDNVSLDIQAINQRLDARMYSESAFFVRNVFDSPRRTREFNDYMLGYAHLAERLVPPLRYMLAHTNARVVMDLCPGSAPKVEIALHQLGFAGEVILADAHRPAIDTLRGVVSMFKPAFTLREDTSDILGESTTKADVVIGNHALDDLWLFFLEREGMLSVDAMYDDELAFVAGWTMACNAARTDRAVRFAGLLAAGLASRLRPGGMVFLNSYPSHTNRSLGVPQVDATLLGLMQKLCAAIPRYQLQILETHAETEARLKGLDAIWVMASLGR